MTVIWLILKILAGMGLIALVVAAFVYFWMVWVMDDFDADGGLGLHNKPFNDIR